MMLYLVSYDVSTATPAGRARLRRVAKACEDFGVRVQNSVFECVLESDGFLLLKARLSGLMDMKQDSLRIYPVGRRGRDKVVHLGVEKAFDVEEPLIL